MNARPARFALSRAELLAIVRHTPGLTLPSFVDGGSGSGSSSTSPAADPAATGARPDPRLLLALGLHAVGDGVIHAVSWSPGVMVRRSIAVGGAVAAAVSRSDAVTDGERTSPSSRFAVALFPARQAAAQLASSTPMVATAHPRDSTARRVGVIASRAIVEAARYGDPALVDDVAGDHGVDCDTVGVLNALAARQASGLRVRSFDGRTGRCVGGGDWFGSASGWLRVGLGFPAPAGAWSADDLLRDATVSVAFTTGTEIRRSLTWLTADLLRTVSR
ncbi:hypothetical protein [uncultured Leifsonia sp.]|uniref:hypothetical protein n=1 Tax=uncultured Leifsonia sp. TaxID=340359 RepID=UPI0025ECEAC2|nr:hypothetical protein [uncultured Leifsonia sp.]